MKQNFRKIKVLFFFLFLSLLSCQPEEEIVEFGKHHNHFTVEKITESEFKKKAPKAFGKMELLEQQFKNKLHSRTVNVNNEFELDTEEIIQITKGDQVSYTLPVYRSVENNLVENLVLTLQNNNSFSAKVISYDLTQSEKDLLQNGMFVDVSSKMQVVNLDNGSTIANDIFARSASGCYDVIIEYEMCCHNIHSTLNVQNGQRCTCAKPPTGYTYTIVSIPCNEDGSGGETPGDTSPGDYTSPGNDNPYGGTGNGTGNTGSPNNENPDNNESEPISSLGDDLTLPVVKPKKTTPCEELNKMTANSNIRNSYTGVNGLNSKVGEPIEYGFAFRRGESHDTVETVPNDVNNPAILKMPSGGNVYGGSHIHPDPNLGYYPMFPAPDIKYLDDIALRYNWNGLPPRDRNYSMFVLTLTVAGGTYAIKIEDWLKFRAVMNDIEKYVEMQKKIEDRFSRAGTDETKLTKILLKTLNEYELGVGLYKAEPDFSNWNKLSLSDPNSEFSNIIPTPCQN